MKKKYLNDFHQQPTEKAVKFLQEQKHSTLLEDHLRVGKETSQGTRFARDMNVSSMVSRQGTPEFEANAAR